MKKTSTYVGKTIVLTLMIALSSLFASAQFSPNLKFSQSELVKGEAGKKKAIYKFTNVIDGVDAFVEIKDIKNGAILINIDDSVFGYYDAWQPTVGGVNVNGNDAFIKWEIKFKTTSGSSYKFPKMDLTAIDIDGDNVKIREYIKVKGHSSFMIPVVTLMQLSNQFNSNSNDDDDDDDNDDNDDDDNDDDDDDDDDDNDNITNSPTLYGLGPVVNRLNIDTMAMDVRVGYNFINKDKIEITTGHIVSNNGYTGAVAIERLNSLYFKYMVPLTALPVTYRTFTAAVNEKTVNLNWVTEIEQGNDHFEVERSFDQVNFRTVGMVLGAQSATSLGKQYSFKDNSSDLNGKKIVYYRLKQVDGTGKFTYSVVRMVRFTTDTKAFVQVSPNPYMDNLNVNFTSEINGKAEVKLINTSGQVTVKKQSQVVKGNNNIQLLNLNSLATGLYIVDIMVDGKVIDRQKIVKQ